MRHVFIWIIGLYQKSLSPETGFLPKIFGRNRKTCIFYPSCSEYSKEVFLKHGSIAGLILTTRRVLRCNPFTEPQVDLVPEKWSSVFKNKKTKAQ